MRAPTGIALGDVIEIQVYERTRDTDLRLLATFATKEAAWGWINVNRTVSEVYAYWVVELTWTDGCEGPGMLRELAMEQG